jgi:F-type H+-transporting ATPase subunit b
MEPEHAAFYTEPTFWVAVAFAIFVGLLLWRRIPVVVAKTLDERAEKIRRELDEAKQLKEEAEALLAQYKAKHAKAAGEAEAILKQAAEEAKLFVLDAEKKLEAAFRRQTKTTEEKISQAEANAVKQVKAAAADTAVRAAGAILGDQLKQGKNARLIDEAIKSLDKRLH